VAIKFYNHPEMMIRNAIRIIVLTVFKLNDERVNALICELPYCSYFVNLACLFRDKLLDLEQAVNSGGGGASQLVET
jgi:hypothetical protein